MNKTKELLDTLLSAGIITEKVSANYEAKLKKPGFNLEEVLIKNKVINAEKLTELKAHIFGLLYKVLIDEDIDSKALNFISEDMAKYYAAVCFNKKDKAVSIGLVEPNLKAMEAVSFLAQKGDIKVKYYLISKESFHSVFRQYQKIEEEISSALKIQTKEGEELVQIKEKKVAVVDEDVNSAPISKIVSVIVRHAVERRASDIHIEPLDKESRIRYRIDGILHTSLVLPKSVHAAVVARIKVLAKLKLDETRIPQDGRTRLLVNDREIDFRISTLPIGGSEKVVMRILDTSQGIVDLKTLGFAGTVLRKIRRSITKTTGMLLVTGPTGSGKTTTLYAILNILNKEGVNISTLEDPVEYQMKGINQSQVKPKIDYTFATGLRSFLRQDPDIIMVGEIRDEETANLCVHASLTGHLVLSTLHTNNAIGTISRLIDMGIEAFLLASTLKVVVAQRLARKLCEHCKKKTGISQGRLDLMIKTLKGVSPEILKEELPKLKNADDIENIIVYQAVGCKRCEDTGYLGRVALGEAIEINDALRGIILDRSKILSEEEIKKTQRFLSIQQDGVIKVIKGITTLEEILRVMDV